MCYRITSLVARVALSDNDLQSMAINTPHRQRFCPKVGHGGSPDKTPELSKSIHYDIVESDDINRSFIYSIVLIFILQVHFNVFRNYRGLLGPTIIKFR